MTAVTLNYVLFCSCLNHTLLASTLILSSAKDEIASLARIRKEEIDCECRGKALMPRWRLLEQFPSQHSGAAMDGVYDANQREKIKL
jgi:hypothetical protein